MLDPRELAEVVERFGVADEQVHRDHLLSHLLGALARAVPDEIVFFGGTALARTHLRDGRLSEDLDLFTRTTRAAVVKDVEVALAEGVRREYGRLRWNPPLSAVKDADAGVLRTEGGLAVRVQLLGETGLPAWPTEHRSLFQRYADAPPAILEVLTLASFAAAKTAAWNERRAARDLYDLWGLALLGALNDEAADLFARLGPTGEVPRAWMFRDPPTETRWRTELAGQTRLTVSATDALAVVRDAWVEIP